MFYHYSFVLLTYFLGVLFVRDVASSIDICHRDGAIKDSVMKDPGRLKSRYDIDKIVDVMFGCLFHVSMCENMK